MEIKEKIIKKKHSIQRCAWNLYRPNSLPRYDLDNGVKG